MPRVSWCVFCSMSVLFDYMCTRLPFILDSKPKKNKSLAYIFKSKVHCGSGVRFGWALPGYPITAHNLYAFLMFLDCWLSGSITNQNQKPRWRHNKPALLLLLPLFVWCLCMNFWLHYVTLIPYMSSSRGAQFSCKSACNHLITWLPAFVYTLAASHHHHVLYSYTIHGRAAARLYFRRKFGWFSLGLGHSSCLVFVLLKFFFAWVFWETCAFKISGNDVFSSFFLFFSPDLFYCLFEDSNLVEINLRPNSRRPDTSFRQHTNKRPPTAHPTTLHSPFLSFFLSTQPHPTYSSPHPPLAPSTPQSPPPHCVTTTA